MFRSMVHLLRGTRLFRVMLAMLGMWIVSGVATDTSAGVVFQDAFNKGNINQRYEKQGGCFPHSFVQKNGVLRITNRFWEDNRNCRDWTSRKQKGGFYTRRAELKPKPSVTQPRHGGEYEWEFDFKLVKASKKDQFVAWQVISSPWNGFDMALRYEKGKWAVYARKGGAKKSYTKKVIGNAKIGKSETITIRFKRSMGKDGYMQVLRDQDLRFHHRGPTTISKSSTSWAKFGIYKRKPVDSKAEFIADIDNLQISRY